MTIEILGPNSASEYANAEKLKTILINSAPELDDPKVRLAIIPQVFASGLEIDCVLVFEDTRTEEHVFRTSNNLQVKSFVACIEIKNHSSDLVRLNGSHLEVQYGDLWKNASIQADKQVWALKSFQETAYWGKKRRDKTYVQSAIWLPRVASNIFNHVTEIGRSCIFYEDLVWQKMIDSFKKNTHCNMIKTLDPDNKTDNYHSYESLVELLTAKIEPTRLDLKRIDALTQKRFDVDKQAYVRDLGKGLLMFRGRAGTGKTFALIQMAIHLARQGKSTRIVTYNHGLISDITRSLTIIHKLYKDINPIPVIDTRWMLMEMLFELTFGQLSAKQVRVIGDLKNREALFLRALCHPKEFLKETIPCSTENAEGKACKCSQKETKTWADISVYNENFPPPYDFLIIDEGQDWSTEHRDLMYKIFGPSQIIVADGIDQFVDKERCNWDRNDILKNRIVTLRTSRRTKAASCDTINDIAHTLKVPDWDVEPDQNATGGRITVMVEALPRRAVERALDLLNEDLANQTSMHPVDALVCFPLKAATPNAVYYNLFESIEDSHDEDYWRGYDEVTRRNRDYPSRPTSLRAVLYQSCRGMEGWTTVCMGLDLFYDYCVRNSAINIENIRNKLEIEMGFLFTEIACTEKIEEERRAYALNWLMIALTRSIDHLVIHLTDVNSALGQVLQKIPLDKINWR